MKNTKEIYAILAAIFCINFSECRDNDINNIIDYAYWRLFGANTNLIALCCIGKTKEQVMPEVLQILNQDTQYSKFLESTKRVDFKPQTIYTVLVDWVNYEGDSETKSYLFSTIEKAKEQLVIEALDELGARKGDDIYCDEGCDKTFIKYLLDKFDDDFNHMNKEENADFIIDANPTYFSSYRQGRYSESHFNVRILEQTIDEAPEETKEDKNYEIPRT